MTTVIIAWMCCGLRGLCGFVTFIMMSTLNVLVLYGHEVLVFRGSWARGRAFLSLVSSLPEMLRSHLKTSPASSPREPSRAALCIQEACGCHGPSWELFETT